jgi:uncharacterized membrane protein YkvA (DUF1232 family)
LAEPPFSAPTPSRTLSRSTPRDRRRGYAKAAAGLVVAYALSPIDLILDFIPVLGYLDELVLVPLGVALVLKLVPAEYWPTPGAAPSRRARSSTTGSRPR